MCNVIMMLMIWLSKMIIALTFLHGKYVVMMLYSLEQIDHLHSIVINMELEFCWFNLDALAFFWGGTAVERKKEKIMTMEWQEENGEDLEPQELFNQLNLLF